MGWLSALIILISTLVTSAISGVFGMAGGLMLMGVLAFILPVQSALALHGVVQISSNGWRMLLHRVHVQWPIVAFFAIGAFAAMGLFAVASFTPTKALVYFALGLLPGLVWVPERWFKLDAAQPGQAMICGLLSTGLSLTAGVSGPFTDLFFINTQISRHQVVATKACMQAFGHLSKIVAYGAALFSVQGQREVPWQLLAGAVGLSMVGIVVGGWILDRMSDEGFRLWRRWIVTVMGAIYLVQAVMLIWPKT